MESLAIRETHEVSAFKEANNATGTPAVRQFSCLPPGLAGQGDGGSVAMATNPAFAPVNGIAHAAPLTHARVRVFTRRPESVAQAFLAGF